MQIDPYYSTKEWKYLKILILERDEMTCQYCGGVGKTADHVRPRRHGGSDSVDNLVCVCERCNRLVRDLVFFSFDAKQRYILEHIESSKPLMWRDDCWQFRRPYHLIVDDTNYWLSV